MSRIRITFRVSIMFIVKVMFKAKPSVRLEQYCSIFLVVGATKKRYNKYVLG